MAKLFNKEHEQQQSTRVKKLEKDVKDQKIRIGKLEKDIASLKERKTLKKKK